MNASKRPTARLIVAAAMFALVAVMGLAACSKAAAPAPAKPTQAERKAMMEAVAKWYVAEGAADLAGIKAAVYDPTDILGLATATPAPADVQRTTVVWKWVGDKIVMTVPGNDEEPTVTVSPAPGDGFNLVLDDGTGSGGTLVMKNVGGVWKIDVAATKRIAEAAGAQEDSSQPTETP